MGTIKREDVSIKVSVKYSEENKYLQVGAFRGQAWRLLTISVFRMGAYSRWALIRGWALTRINTVYLVSDYMLTPYPIIVPRARLAERAWNSKFQSSIQNTYFRLSGFQPSLLLIQVRDGPNRKVPLMGFSGSGICVTAIDRDSGFQGKMGARFGMENMEWMGDATGSTRWRESLGRDYGNKESCCGQLNR